MSGVTTADLLSALAWQVDLGADEAIADAPVDRFASTPQPAPADLTTRTIDAPPRGRSGATGPAGVARPGPGEARRAEPDGAEAGAHDAQTRHAKTRATQARAPKTQAGTADSSARLRGAGAEAAHGSHTLAAAADSLDALAEAMRSHDGSDLKRSARNFCFADGNPVARLMVIGEAPGAEEDRIGRPFVGRAGQLLDLMLRAIGHDRTSAEPERAAYITNLLPWRPPGNRTPSSAEAAMFLPFLERHIALADPDVVLCLGNPATQALLATSTGIKRMRGRWVRHQATGKPLLPSFHPAYLLRQPADKRLSWRDLLTVQAVLQGEPPEGL